MTDLNLTLPGNPRYQPKMLRDIYGYDKLYEALALVELTTLETLAEIGIIPKEHMQLLTKDLFNRILNIRTTDVDRVERAVTKHDVRAWIRLAQEILPEPLRHWLHVPLTSYDALDTARSLQLLRAHVTLSIPIKEVIAIFADLVRANAETVQIGRTHGQHALPITVGFWLANILARVLGNARIMDQMAGRLVGKISGAVGAYNAQVGLGIKARCGDMSFEERVLRKLGLRPALISSQILPLEGAAYYLFSATMLSAAFAQLGRDCRQLMRTEIAEIGEPFEEGQVGSSTMAHKRNPITFENLEGMGVNTVTEFIRVLMTLVSEHQRDLVGSSSMRYFPTILVNLAYQLETLLKKDRETGMPFLARLTVNRAACEENVAREGNVILAEPLYIGLQMAGYRGDAHELVNRTLVPIAKKSGKLLIEVAEEAAASDSELGEALGSMDSEIRSLMRDPSCYIGDAREKCFEVVGRAEEYCTRTA